MKQEPSAAPRPPFRIKICGQTSLADARASIDAGADMLGFIFFPGSKRYLPWTDSEWVTELPEKVERVAVFVDPSLGEVRTALESGRFHTAQLHGSEPPEFLARLNDAGFAGRVIKALRVGSVADLADLGRFGTTRFLLDGPEPGSGKVFDWAVAREALARRPDATFLLAGGLRPENVAAAIQSVHPHGVDVASGVESAPGRKDYERLRAFVAAARRGADGE